LVEAHQISSRQIKATGYLEGSESRFQQTARILALPSCTRMHWSRLPFRNSKHCFDQALRVFGCVLASFLLSGVRIEGYEAA